MKYKIITFGCVANKSDSNVMKHLLNNKGFSETEKEEEADLVIINTCGVKGVTENKIINQISKIKNKKVLIAGCLPKINEWRLKKTFPNYSLIGPDQVLDVVDVVEKVFKGNIVLDTSSKYCERILDLDSQSVEIVPISQGCLGSCNFCGTKHARGNLNSYPINKIIQKIKSSNAKLFYLTSQDNGCYGRDIDTSLTYLLKEILKIDKKFKLRIGMANPNYVLGMLDELVEIYKNEKIIKFLHIPVQSGSDNTLKDMNRYYSRADFVEIVNKFRKEIKGIVISTDIIVGYPTETREDFEKTLTLIRETTPEVVNISKYYNRPGTKASKLKQLTSQEVKSRSRELSGLIRSLRA